MLSQVVKTEFFLDIRDPEAQRLHGIEMGRMFMKQRYRMGAHRCVGEGCEKKVSANQNHCRDCKVKAGY